MGKHLEMLVKVSLEEKLEKVVLVIKKMLLPAQFVQIQEMHPEELPLVALVKVQLEVILVEMLVKILQVEVLMVELLEVTQEQKKVKIMVKVLQEEKQLVKMLIKDISETNEENIKAESRPQEINMPLQQSA